MHGPGVTLFLMSEQTPTPAGWYPDPQNPGQQRYWDGTAWAAPTAPPPPAAPPASPQGQLAAPPQTSTSGLIGLVLSVVSWVICPIIAAVVALFLARSSDKEIAASEGRITGKGLNTATRIISWINIGVSVVAGLILAVLAGLGIGFFASVASSVDPAVNDETGLSDGNYVMEPTRSTVLNEERCTYGGPVYDSSSAQVANTTVYGEGRAICGGDQPKSNVYIEVTNGLARIVSVD